MGQSNQGNDQESTTDIGCKHSTKGLGGARTGDVDEFLSLVGEFGSFQMCVEFLFCIAYVPVTFQVLISYFVSYNPAWECVPGSKVCKFNRSLSVEDSEYKSRCLMRRKDWKFSQPHHYSVVTEFDLQCETEVFIYLTTSIYFVGWAFGGICLGWLADSYGRKPTLFISLFGILLFGLAGSFAPNIWVYLVLRFIVGFFQPGTGPQMSVYISEFVGPKKRPLASSLLFIFYTIGLCTLGIKAYFIRNWRKLLLVCTAPYAFILLFAFYVPESVRWLHSQGKTVEAMNILRRIARTNGRAFPSALCLKSVISSSRDSGCHLLAFVQSKTLFLRTALQSVCWIVVGLSYFGLSLAADDMGGGLYSDFMLASLVELPAAVVSIIGCNRYGRKPSVLVPLFISALACAAVPFFPANVKPVYTYLRITLGMSGKFFNTISFDSVYTWSFELFATTIRAEGMGIMQVMSRIGAATAPFITKGLDSVNPGLPFYLIGGLSLVTSLSLCFLPETKGKATVESVHETDRQVPKVESIEERSLVSEVGTGYGSVQA